MTTIEKCTVWSGLALTLLSAAASPAAAQPPHVESTYRFYFVNFEDRAGFAATIQNWNVCLQNRCSILEGPIEDCPDKLCETIDVKEVRLSGTPAQPGYEYDFEHRFSKPIAHNKIPSRRQFKRQSRTDARTRMLELLRLDLLCHDQSPPHQLERVGQQSLLPQSCRCVIE